MTLTNDQYKEMCKNIIKHGEGRKEVTDKFKEDDFLCGAMACMDALGIALPVWPFMIMAGRKVILTDYEKVEEADVKDLPLMLDTVKGSAKELLIKRMKGC
jgi:hypothetical protein